ncbi:kinase-like protein [Rhizophagus irregularis]|uniref:Kinase-like protein n=1 Tax=Rhizophagus irregularis TaxID=588596 RepID=A0A2N0R222_9GLOM|nr:kinase-like protein [Rhizophagus irregularis]
MDEIKLSDDIIEQIKDFDRYLLTEEQKSLINKLIIEKELKEHYKKYGLCKICKQPNTDDYYCRSCNSKRFQRNFKNWTSGNHNIDEFIQKTQLKAKNSRSVIEWIEYDKFEDVVYLAKGGFGTIFKAVWKDGYIKMNYNDKQLERNSKIEVALKSLHKSQDIIAEFLKEVESHILTRSHSWIVRCFGITKDPKTNNFMIVMDLKKGWKDKLNILYRFSIGLEDIHNSGLIHHDLHCGNILSDFDHGAFITDLGLCQPANNMEHSQSDNKKIYGVLPYVAPEVLRGKEYIQKSDIYGFGIWLRPKFNYKIPQLIIDIINQCWDADPSKRHKVDKLVELHFDLLINLNKEDSVIHKQIEEADEINKKSSLMVRPPSFTNTLSYMIHPQAVYTSRLLDFKNLPEPKNADNNDDLLGIKYSDSLRIDFTKLDINSKGNEWGDENDSGWDEEFSLLNEPYKKRKFRICPEKYGKCPEIFWEKEAFEDKSLVKLKSRRFKQLLNNRTHAIYEYLKRLGKNGKGKMKASKEAAQLIFIDCVPYRARSIQYWANFWLQHNHLPVSCQGKYQKTI